MSARGFSGADPRGTEASSLLALLLASLLSVGLGWLAINSAASGRLTIFVASFTIVGILALVGRKDLTRPEILLPVVWFTGVGLSQLNLLSAYQTPWSERMIVVAFVAPAAFAIGSLIAGSARRRPDTTVSSSLLSVGRLRAAATLLLFAGIAGVAWKAQLTGGVALFANEIDSLRSAGGIHVPAWVTMLTDCLFLSLWCALLIFAQKRPATERLYDGAIAISALAGVSLSASRNTLMIAVTIPLIYIYLSRGWGRISPGRALGALAVGALIAVTVSGLFFVRTGQHRQSRFESNFYTYVVPKTPAPARPLLPFYISLTAPLETLNRAVRRSDAAPRGGVYSVPGIPPEISPFGPRADFYAFTGAISRPYYFNVATYAGPPYTDGKMPLVLIASLLLGLGAGGVRRWALTAPTALKLGILAYVTYLIAFLIYENILAMFTMSVVFDLLVIALVISWCTPRAIGDPDA